VAKRIPAGAKLPEPLAALSAALSRAAYGDLGYFDIVWTKPGLLLDLTTEARTRVVPFASLACGDLLALWWEGELSRAPHVLHLGAHGEKARVFESVPVFIGSLIARNTRVSDLDEGTAAPKERAAMLDVARPRAGKPSPALATRFARWVRTHTPAPPQLDPGEMERIRKKLVAVVRREAGWTRRQLYRQWRLIWTPKTGAVDWFAGGRVPFPAAAELKDTLTRLAELAKLRGRKIEITLDSEGNLYPDRRTLIAPT
jgi:hypothetical protein